MTGDSSREDQALDALIAAAFRQDACAELTLKELLKLETALGPEDRAALSRLGSDLVQRIVEGRRSARPGNLESPADTAAGHCDAEIAGAMFRGDDGGRLTDAAREEMERKLKELKSGEATEGPGEPPA